MVKNRAIAIIPARGGSKRIPQKNIKDFMGRPMIAWTIEAAIQSQVFDSVFVSTDDTRIAEISIKYGAECPFLRQDAYDDNSVVSQATLSSLHQIEQKQGGDFQDVVQLMPNCPVRDAKTIINMYETYKRDHAKFYISAFKYGYANPWWAHKIQNDGKVESIFPEALTTRSQDLPDLSCPTGAIWIADCEAFKTSGTFYGPGYKFYNISWQDAVDIDDYDDWEFAEAVYSMKHKA